MATAELEAQQSSFVATARHHERESRRIGNVEVEKATADMERYFQMRTSRSRPPAGQHSRNGASFISNKSCKTKKPVFLAAKIQYAHIKNQFNSFNTDQKSIRKSPKV